MGIGRLADGSAREIGSSGAGRVPELQQSVLGRIVEVGGPQPPVLAVHGRRILQPVLDGRGHPVERVDLVGVSQYLAAIEIAEQLVAYEPPFDVALANQALLTGQRHRGRAERSDGGRAVYRSEERSVGKDGGSAVISRWSL